MPEIMTPREVAQYLKMSVLTVYKHAKVGIIPGFRVGNSWRFDKGKIDELLVGERDRGNAPELRNVKM